MTLAVYIIGVVAIIVCWVIALAQDRARLRREALLTREDNPNDWPDP